MFHKIFHRRRKQLKQDSFKSFNVSAKIVFFHCRSRDSIIIILFFTSMDTEKHI